MEPNGHADSISVSDIDFGIVDPGERIEGPFGEAFFSGAPDGPPIRVVPEITEEKRLDDSPLSRGRQRLRNNASAVIQREAKAGVPNIDEWMNFFSRVLIKTATNLYIDVAFRGIDENILTEREVQRIKLSDQERDRIARPFAELSHKSKFMRKHGRTIVASGDSIDAIISLGMWYSRVSRIASRCRNASGQPVRRQRQESRRPSRAREEYANERPGPDHEYNGSAGGREFTPAPREPGWRPDIPDATIFNPYG